MSFPLSSSESLESLTSRSTESMEVDTLSVMGNSPQQRPDSPVNEAKPDIETPVVVDEETTIVSEPSAMKVGHDEEEDDPVVPFVKRKRTSVNYNLDETGGYGTPTHMSPYSEPPAKKPRQTQKIRGVPIGVWRDSELPDDADKHVIYGFIDVHDRLRTRIYNVNRRGEEITTYAVTGVGGCWVTFEKILFDPHLQGLNPSEVKEYVKLRLESKPDIDEGIEARNIADMKAVIQAKTIAASLEAASPKPVVPRRQYTRKSLPAQPIYKIEGGGGGGFQAVNPGFQAVNAADFQTPKASPSIERPTGVLLGYWADSSEPVDADKHAAYGVLSGSDCFRVKVQKITRDGRFMEGNIPVGAGSMWISYEKVVLDPHLAGLDRSEVKEYCRVRLQDVEHRESENERKANELRAVQRAQAVVAEQKMNGRFPPEPEFPGIAPEFELRQSARSVQRLSSRNQGQVIADEASMLQVQKEKAEARERQVEQTRREVAAAEATHKAPAESGLQEAAQMELKNNIKKLNKVWVKQQAATMPGAMSPAAVPSTPTPIHQMEQEVRYHNGIKYERKQTGPLQGKLVSSAQLLTIDGEDFVEYRVLTKPTF